MTNIFQHYKKPDFLNLWLILGLVHSLPLFVILFLTLFSLSYPFFSPVIRAKHKLVISVSLIVGLALITFTVKPLVGGTTLLAFIALVSVLKRAELHTDRDRWIYITAISLTVMLNLVHWNNMIALLHLIALFLLIVFFIKSQKNLNQKSFHSLKIGFWVLPLAIGIFLLFPRITGPLWNFGIAFNMPIKVYEHQLNSKIEESDDENSDGEMSNLQAQNKVILLAEFSLATPSKKSLYWRGRVSYRYEDGQWLDSIYRTTRAQRMSSAYRDIGEYQQLLQYQKTPVSLKVKVAANRQNWLYAPDLPLHNVQESFISKDGQLLSIRPLLSEFNYSISSVIDGSFRPVNKPDIDEDIELPPNHAESMQLLAQQWSEDFTTQDQSVLANRSHFIKTQLIHLLNNPPDWLDVKPPYSATKLEKIIGHSMLMVQLADIPARMVSGYRGGDSVALTDVVVVRQKHRHHWLEIWDKNFGWTKLDIKDLLTANQNYSLNRRQNESNETTKESIESQISNQIALDNENSQSWWKSVENWLQEYKPDSAGPNFSSPGLQSDKYASLINILVYCLAIATLLLIWVLTFNFYKKYRNQQTPHERAWALLETTLQTAGILRQPWQCPTVLIDQVEKTNSNWNTTANQLIHKHLKFKYGTSTDSEEEQQFCNDVKAFIVKLKTVKRNQT
ncbi:DUF3488 and transglutaminase-like domain-containing protein [Sessilibacter corallicola]|uniref:Transglutaminase-like domain-containing protein n=1 Tax=Sessilibacter corallicola TaxID=2904075 RepID=A0ABQ0AAU5_9GAMM